MNTRLPPSFRKKSGRKKSGLPEDAELPVDGLFWVKPDPDAPDDDEPLPDAMQQEEHVTETIQVVRTFFRGRPGVLVSGDSPVYYPDAAGRQQIFRPDCYVAFGVNPITIRRRNGYFIDDVGKAPDFALEIASISTYRNDLGPKRELYARLGIGEYWRFDSTGGNFYREPLAGEELVEGEYRRFPVHRGADGIIRGHSPTLGLDLCWIDGDLKFFDPAEGVYLLNLADEQVARRVAEARAIAGENARLTLEGARRAEQARANAEENARRAAEAEVQLLRERLRQLEEPPPGPESPAAS